MRNESMTRSMAEIEADMEASVKALAEVDKEYRVVSSRRTGAINTVNRLQKEFDERVQGLRWSAPQQTDWRAPKLKPAEAA